MPLTFESVSRLLKAEILTIGDINFIQLNDRYVITDNSFNKEIELNNLETHSSQSLSKFDITDILNSNRLSR